MLKLDADGNVEWQRCLGGSGSETPGQIAQTPDGGYILVGSASSLDGDVEVNLGSSDIWLVRLTSTGTLLWERSFGGSEIDMGEQLAVLPDGRYLITGVTFSMDGHATDNHGGSDFWLGYVSEDGNLLQSRCYGGTGLDHPRVMQVSEDGVVILGGVTSSADGDVAGNVDGWNGAWILYLANGWDIDWQTVLGGTGDDQTYGVARIEADIVVALVLSDSQDGDITNPWGDYDYWLVKLDTDGTLLQQRSFGGSGQDSPRALISSNSGQSMTIAGRSGSNDGLVSGSNGGTDFWLLSVDEDFEVIWESSYGGSGGEGCNGACYSNNGRLTLIGQASSNDGDLLNNYGLSDVWVVKLEPRDVGVRPEVSDQVLRVYPNPAEDVLTISWEDEASAITVFDARGKLIASLDGLPAGQRQYQLNVEAWADGLYTVQLNGEGTRQVQRFAKH